MKQKILITDITSYKAVVIARFIKKNYPNIEIHASDHRSYAKKFKTKYVDHFIHIASKIEDGDKYSKEISLYLKKHQISTLIPVNSKEIRVLMLAQEELAPCLDYVSAINIYHQLDDKGDFEVLLNSLELPRPLSYRTLLEAKIPFVVKPKRGSSSEGVYYVNNEQEREQVISIIKSDESELVIQDFILGEGIGLSGIFINGEAKYTYAHKRVAEYPTSGGSSAIREPYTYNDLPKLEALISKITTNIKWSGFAMFELKRTENGDFYFIECNPRIWGSIHQGLANGINYFEPLLGKIHQKHKITNVTTQLFPLSLLSLLGYIKKLNLRKALKVTPYLFYSKNDVSPFEDLKAFIAMILRKQ